MVNEVKDAVRGQEDGQRLLPLSEVEGRIPYPVHRNTLTRWAREGLIDVVRCGKRYMLTPVGLQQLLSGEVGRRA